MMEDTIQMLRRNKKWSAKDSKELASKLRQRKKKKKKDPAIQISEIFYAVGIRSIQSSRRYAFA